MRMKEHLMTSNARGGDRLLGSLRAADGKGIVRMEARFATEIAEVWAALTDPRRLAHWIGAVTGDLRLGGAFRARFLTSGWEGTGRVEVCAPPQRLVLRTTAADEPTQLVDELTLTAAGDQTLLVLEERGMPLDQLAAYGAGVQLHVEELAAYLAGHERRDRAARWAELFPAYQALAANVS